MTPIQTTMTDGVGAAYLSWALSSHIGNQLLRATTPSLETIVQYRTSARAHTGFVRINVNIVGNGRPMLSLSRGDLYMTTLAPGSSTLIYLPQGMHTLRLSGSYSACPDVPPTFDVMVLPADTVHVNISAECYAEYAAKTGFTVVAYRDNRPTTAVGFDLKGSSRLHGMSPDGSRMMFTNNGSGGYSLYIALADGSQITRLTTDGSVTDPRWSPDGSRVLFTRNGEELVVADASNGSSTVLYKKGAHGAWSPDGTQIMFVCHLPGGTNLCLVNADGSDVQTLLTGFSGVTKLWWSPDGTRITFQAIVSDTPRVILARADGSDARIAVSSTPTTDSRWSHDGSALLVLAATRIFRVDRNGGNLATIWADSAVAHVDWSGDGAKIIVGAVSEGSIYVMNPDGTNRRLISKQSFTPMWNPRARPGSSALAN